MGEHECEWEVLKPEQSEPEWYIWCSECGDRMETIEEINAFLNEHAALKRLLQRAEDVQEGKMDYAHTFCWWCGGLKHDMTKNSAFYCDGAALLVGDD